MKFQALPFGPTTHHCWKAVTKVLSLFRRAFMNPMIHRSGTNVEEWIQEAIWLACHQIKDQNKSDLMEFFI